MVLQTSYLTATAPPPPLSLLYLRVARISTCVVEGPRFVPNHKVTHKKLSLFWILQPCRYMLLLELPAVSELSIIIAGLRDRILMVRGSASLARSLGDLGYSRKCHFFERRTFSKQPKCVSSCNISPQGIKMRRQGPKP